MNPNQNREGPQINFELPAQPPPPENADQAQEQAVEAPPARQEQVGKQAPQAVPLPPAPDDIPAADQPVVAAPQDITSPPAADPQASAHDSDHIEPIWVNKIKNIAASTHDDPYLQKDQMSKIKADYIQKRFNKSIKTDEAAA